MPDMVSIFNQLTQYELADCMLFENILDKHYQKFTYFYAIVEDLRLDDVVDIKCTTDDKALLIFMIFKKKSDAQKFHAILNSEIASLSYSTYAKYFSITIKETKTTLNISIEGKKYSVEEDMYEDRFNSR